MKCMCKYCANEFEQKYKTQVYCSKQCKGKDQAKKNRLVGEKKYLDNPRICQVCGEIIPFDKRKNKFCSQKCAAIHTNKNRIRNKWSDVQKKNFSIKCASDEKKSKYFIHHCKYCGVKLDAPNKRVCDECRTYLGYLRTFNKFSLINGSLKERYVQLVKIICGEYFDDMDSMPTISKRYNIDITTVYKILKKENRVRSISEGVINSIRKNIYDPCSVAPNSFITGTHISWDGKEYHYRSSWEDKYMTVLDERKIIYLYEPFRIEYYDPISKCNRFAYPDFYLPDSNTIIELKSSYTLGNIDIMEAKMRKYSDLGYNTILLLDWHYLNINDIDKLRE